MPCFLFPYKRFASPDSATQQGRTEMTQPSFFYRHYRFACLWTIFALLAFSLLTGCTNTTPADTPSFGTRTTYGAADATHLALLTLQQQQGSSSDLTGSWTTWSAGFSQGTMDVSPPQATRFPISGQIHDVQPQQTILTISVGGSILTAKAQAKELSLNGTFAQVDFQPITWVAIPNMQNSNQLLTAFQQAIVARKHLMALQRLLNQTPPPQDSDPVTYAFFVQEAQSYMQRLQRQHDLVLNSDHPCGTGALALFNMLYPPDASIFKLSNAEVAQDTPAQNAQLITSVSSFGRTLQGLQAAWQSISHMPVPQVSGLSYTWQPSQHEETQTVQQAQKQLNTLQHFLTTDAQTLADLKQQAQQLAAEVQDRAQKQGCA
jgi:hypothetical protein